MIIVNIIIGIVGLGIVVLVHETGHFIAAKAVGIDVEAFSIGWGKVLYAKTFRGTEYRISLLPFGGYCKMKGEEILKRAITEDRDKFDQEEGSLFSVSPLKRFITYLAGPLFNFIFALLVSLAIWSIGFNVYTYGNKILLLSDYSQENEDTRIYPADTAGLQSGDIVTAINGREVEYYYQLQEMIAVRAQEETVLTVNRNGRSLDISIIPELEKSTGRGFIGVSAFIPPVIDYVAESSPAYIAGIQPGDTIVAVNGTEVNNHLEVFQFLESRQPLRLVIERKGSRIETTLIPHYDAEDGVVLGIGFQGFTVRKKASGVIDAVVKGTGETFDTLFTIIKSLGLLFKGVEVKSAVSGPMRIIDMLGSVTTQSFSSGIAAGFYTFFRLVSLLSIALCFMNLLPIPALDGGFLIMNFLEMIIKKNVTPKIFYRFQLVGFFVIITLLFLSTFSDIIYFINK